MYLEKAVTQGAGANDEGILGSYYDGGIGVTRDHAKAMILWQQASERGSTIAQSRLAETLMFGDAKSNFTPRKDAEQALLLWQKAAEHGNCNAQRSLAWCLFYGWEIERDAKKGFSWMQKAAESGNANAQFELAHLYKTGTGNREKQQEIH